jgi:RNA polymerase sigma-70 factor, ECF subfamily
LLNRLRMQHACESRAIAISGLERESPAFRPLGAEYLLNGCRSDWGWHLWRDRSPEEILLDREAVEIAVHVIGKLPSSQRRVIVMRDIEGVSSKETRAALYLSKANQRVLLHRARSKVRAALAGNRYDKGKTKLTTSIAVKRFAEEVDHAPAG